MYLLLVIGACCWGFEERESKPPRVVRGTLANVTHGGTEFTSYQPVNGLYFYERARATAKQATLFHKPAQATRRCAVRDG